MANAAKDSPRASEISPAAAGVVTSTAASILPTAAVIPAPTSSAPTSSAPTSSAPTSSAPASAAPASAAPPAPTRATRIPIGLPVHEVLTVPALAGARLVAGADGAHRTVERINVMEVPDILPWVKPHELLLTTGFPLRHATGPLAELIEKLDQAGLAALAIKPHRYLGGIPADLLEAADALGFPVIELPETVAFDDILTDVLSDILDRQAVVLARADRVHRALLQVVLDGGGLTELAAELARILGGPVFATTPDGRVVAEHGEPGEIAAARRTKCFDTVTADTADRRLRTEREPEGLAAHHGAQHVLVPIVAGRVDHGRLVAFAVQRPFDAADVDALERAATVAALALAKQLAVSAVEDKYRADYLRDLLTGRLEDPLQAAVHCASLGWDIAGGLVVVVAELDPGQSVLPATQFALRPAQERFAAAWHTVVQQRDPTAPVAGFNQEVVVVLKASETTDALVRRLIGAVSGGGGGGRRTFSTGVSRPVRDPAGLATAYEEARRAVRIGRRLNGHGSVAHFDSLGVYRLLSLVPDAAELRAFADETLKGLARDGDADMADLRTTLEVLLDQNLNVAEAARRLHFHYNTLRYRIGKIERLVGPFMERADLRLDLTIALRILHMRGL